jgi:hypothetical protein
MTKHKYSIEDFLSLKNKLSKNKCLDVNIISNSLSPWIVRHQSVKLKKAEVEDLKPFDIIVYWSDEKLICHIYYKIFDGKVMAKGLQSKQFDQLFSPKLILGLVEDTKFNFIQRFFLRKSFKQAKLPSKD